MYWMEKVRLEGGAMEEEGGGAELEEEVVKWWLMWREEIGRSGEDTWMKPRGG